MALPNNVYFKCTTEGVVPSWDPLGEFTPAYHVLNRKVFLDLFEVVTFIISVPIVSDSPNQVYVSLRSKELGVKSKITNTHHEAVEWGRIAVCFTEGGCTLPMRDASWAIALVTRWTVPFYTSSLRGHFR